MIFLPLNEPRALEQNEEIPTFTVHWGKGSANMLHNADGASDHLASGKISRTLDYDSVN